MGYKGLSLLLSIICILITEFHQFYCTVKNVLTSIKRYNEISKFSLLYVDDSVSLLEIMKYILERKQEMSVQICQNPEKICSLLIEREYDIVMSDFDMPGMNGMELFQQIRSEGFKIPFILYSSYSLEEITGNSRKDDSFFYLDKKGPICDHYEKIKAIIMESKKIQTLESPDNVS